MAKTVLMPKQGNTVESCIILEWKKQEGDTVQEGEVLCEAETDKATIEVESTASGTVLKLLYEADDEVPVLQPMAVIGDPDEDISGITFETEHTSGQQTAQAQQLPETRQDKKIQQAADPEQSGAFSKASSPRARNSAVTHGVDITRLSGTGPGGRIIERDIAAASAMHQPLTPAAAQRSAAEGLEVPASGTGIGGRIRLADLGTAPAARLDLDFPGPSREISLKSIRKITAQRMYESLQNTAQLTMTSSANASAMLAFRSRLKHSSAQWGLQSVTVHDMILFAASRMLKEHQNVNAHFLGEKTIEFQHAHIGFAVDTPKGLMVPVLTFADMRSLSSISAEAKLLAGSCKEGKASADMFEGATFTVTNLGALGIEHFTPVLNPPQAAILGVNTIIKRPVEAEDGAITLQPYITFSLTFDHQALDGAPAARFLRDLVQAVESIDLLAML